MVSPKQWHYSTGVTPRMELNAYVAIAVRTLKWPRGEKDREREGGRKEGLIVATEELFDYNLRFLARLI
jgi:hypothetical protein